MTARTHIEQPQKPCAHHNWGASGIEHPAHVTCSRQTKVDVSLGDRESQVGTTVLPSKCCRTWTSAGPL